MNVLPDLAQRLRALNGLDRTLLVEAAAGTGKTALIAGRVVMLLARGIEPKSIAAITYTVFAASELALRVARYVDDLLGGEVPRPLLERLPNGLSVEQRTALKRAAADLDELSANTIHAFCHQLIIAYPVEADVDPGARLMEEVEQGAVFDQVFGDWLKRRLSGEARGDDVVAVMTRDAPRTAADDLREFARFRIRHRDGRAPPANLSGRPDRALSHAVAAFRAWYDATGVREGATANLLEDLALLAAHYDEALAREPDIETLWRLAQPPALGSMRRDTRDLTCPRLKTAWARAAGKAKGEALHAAFMSHFDAVDSAYRTLSGRVAGALLERVSVELEAYDRYKRAAALLDFDDLLFRARALVRDHDVVRRELAERYQYILIDEFQDTDPLQTEIFFRLGAETHGEDWRREPLRSGALFMVGDPKQAIYRFRGADVDAYAEARAIVLGQEAEGLVEITANFRSRPGILDHVNGCFSGVLNAARGQPDYVALKPTLGEPEAGRASVLRLDLDLERDPNATAIRVAEAEAVAAACKQLIGAFEVTNERGERHLLRACDIALLAPRGSGLVYYERALAAAGLSFVSQAGRGFFRRQEVQDMLALTRALADGRDTLALGALLRGPLVGLNEEELLDITARLPAGEFGPGRLTLRGDIGDLGHPEAERVLGVLRELRRKASTTTPALILAEAVERLDVRAILAARGGARAARHWANIEAFIERARPYAVRGLKRFANDMTRTWKAVVRDNDYLADLDQGRLDADGDAIEIVTMHKAKGLEWPVVIPINASTQFKSPDQFIYRMSDKTLHWMMGEVAPPELTRALTAEAASEARERERLWYVACTRARDLLILPSIPQAATGSWARVINLDLSSLRAWSANLFEPNPPPARSPVLNTQDAKTFADERARIVVASRQLEWINPSRSDPDKLAVEDMIAVETEDAPQGVAPIGAGRRRGLVLHKLMEEVLTGETREELSALTVRARLLSAALTPAEEEEDAPDPGEMAATVLKTFALPDVARLRAQLVPEFTLYAMLDASSALSARADAIALAEGQATIVLDWKSDVAPDAREIARHTQQLSAYLQASGAVHGALVYMTSGQVRWVDPPVGG